MSRADFYLIATPRFRGEPLRLVCELAKRCHAAGQPTLVLCASQIEAETLDDLLWAFEEDSFIEHQIAGSDAPTRPYVINPRADAAPKGFEPVLEVVPAAPDARAPLRERWRQYQAYGITPVKHDM